MSDNDKHIKPKRSIARKIIIVFLTVLIIFFSFLFAILVLISLPSVQNFAKNKAVAMLSEKTGASIRIADFYAGFDGIINLLGVEIIDHQKDTLLNAEVLKIKINTSLLFKKQIDIISIGLDSTAFNLNIFDTAGTSNLSRITDILAGPKNKEVEKSNANPSWKIKIHEIRIRDADFNFTNLNDSMLMQHHAGAINIKFRLADVLQQRFIAKQVDIADYNGRIITYKKSFKQEKEDKDTSKGALKMVLAIPDINLKNIAFAHYDSLSGAGGKYLVNSARIVPKNIDLARQKIIIDSMVLNHSQVVLKGSNIQKKQEAQSKAKKTSTAQKSWEIALLNSKIELDSIYLKQMVPGKKGYEYLSELKFTNAQAILQAEFQSADQWESKLLQLSFTDSRSKQRINLNLKAKAANKHIFLEKIGFKTGRSEIAGNLTLHLEQDKGSFLLPDFYFNILLYTKDILAYIPASMVPEIIKNPESTRLKADLHSENQVFRGILTAKADFGTIHIDAGFKNEKQASQSSYKALITLSSIDLGNLLSDTSMGVVSGKLNIKGKLPQNNLITASASALFDSLIFKNVTYRNIALNTQLKDSFINLTVYSGNPFADFGMQLSGNYLKKVRNLNLKGEFRNIDLRAMHFTKDTLSFESRINLNLVYEDSSSYMIYADTSDWLLKTKNNEISTKQQWSYYSAPDTFAAEFYSGNINFLYTGNLGLDKIAPTLSDYFSQYYASKKEKEAIDPDKRFTLSLSMTGLEDFAEILPRNMKIQGENMIYAELGDNGFKANIDMEHVLLNDFEFDSIDMKINSDSSSLNLNMALQMYSPKYNERAFNLFSSLEAGQLDSRIKISDPEGLDWFNFGFTALLDFPILKAKVTEPLVISSNTWVVDTSNILYVNNKEIQQLNILLENEQKMLRFYVHPNYQNVYGAEFKELSLSFFSELLWGDAERIDGGLYGNLLFSPAKAENTLPTFDVEININEMQMQDFELGNLRLKASNRKNRDLAEINFRQNLNQAEFFIKGIVGLKDENQMNLVLISRNFDISKYEPLVQNFLTEPKGIINANLNISGTSKQPYLEGSLEFSNLSLGLNAINTPINIDGQIINFRPNEIIEFKSFTITDGRDNPLTINGTLNYSDLKSLTYQLKLNTRKFQVYSTPDDVLAGRESRILLTSDIQISGKGQQPVVRANLQIDEGSKFFHQLSNQNNYSEAGVVVFADTAIVIPNTPTSIAKNLTLTANLTIANGTAIHIITDPARGDGFNLQAGGALSISQQPYQDPRLTGKIDISKGQYIMNLTGFKRNFEIGPGSSINWNGDIMNIDFKLHAYYTVKASPVPILPNADANRYPGLLPFEVNLNLEGSLSEPEMEFDITLPEEYQDVYNGMVASRLQQINTDEAMVNKQAMSLLLFGTFFDLSDISNSLLSGRSSTNIIISNALNQFAAQEIKFVNLHFDLQTYDYYGSGENYQDARTELKIDATKRFWDGKMNTQAGADILLQGDPREEADMKSNRITPSFKVDYFVNKKRTVSLKIFQQNEYRGLLEGKVISVGAGIQYSNDYNKVGDLLKKDKTDNVYIQ